MKKNIILDTDIGPDCDDAAALAMLNLYADQGLCRILGITHCTSNPYGAGTIDAINRYYGREGVEIGTYYGEGFLSDEKCMTYNRYIAAHYPNRYRDAVPEEAVRLYRRILSEQEEKSVDFIAIGPLNNLSALLNSSPDEYSSLNGTELVRQKGKRITLMAGAFRSCSEKISDRAEKQAGKKLEEISEFNAGCDIAAARNVAENWPTPKDYIGFEAGLVTVGESMKTAVPEDHPVRMAYLLFSGRCERFAWDLMTVAHAIEPDSPFWVESEPGKAVFDRQGRTVWTPCRDGNDRYVEPAEDEERLVEYLNRMLITPPAGGFPKKR